MADKDFKNQIEALLFSSGRVMDAETLANLIGASNKQVIINNVNKLKQEYDERDSPIMIVEENESWKLNVRERYLPLVRKIVGELELPKTILETLAVIAWRSPVVQSVVIDIRHNKAYDHIAELEELGFISKEKQGRSFVLKVTNKFFEYFEVEGNKGLKDIFKEIQLSQKKDTKIGPLEVYTEGNEKTRRQSTLPLGNALDESNLGEHLGPLEVYDEDAKSKIDDKLAPVSSSGTKKEAPKEEKKELDEESFGVGLNINDDLGVQQLDTEEKESEEEESEEKESEEKEPEEKEPGDESADGLEEERHSSAAAADLFPEEDKKGKKEKNRDEEKDDP